jgi:hypothetical protein
MTSSERSGPGRGTEPGRQLIGEWAVCAIAAAAARFIPVPLLDDAVKFRAIRIAVLRTLRANGRTYSSDVVEPLYAGVDAASSGMVRRAFRYLATVPRRVILFPIRKYVALFGSVRGVPTDVMTVVLLARTVHRCLVEGRLADADQDRLRAEAVQIRAAFDRALDGMDLRLFTGALSDGLSQGRGLTSAAVAYARKTFGRSDGDSQSAGELAPGGAVGAGAEQIEQVMRRPEIARLISEFDATFDAELAHPSKGPGGEG